LRRRTLSWLTAGFLLVLALVVKAVVPWPLYYRQEPISARIVDATTGQPIKDAAVVAVWQEEHSGWERRWSTYRYDEAITSSNGTFLIPGWGPKWRQPGAGRLTEEDPDLYVYAPGYELRYVNNRTAYVQVIGLPNARGTTIWVPTHTPGPGQVAERYPGWRWGGATRYCFWNGKTIGMTRTASPADDARVLRTTAEGMEADIKDPGQPPRFWHRWHDGWRLLPPPLRATIAERP